MVNQSKARDSRFWKKWAESGAVDCPRFLRDTSGKECLLSREAYRLKEDITLKYHSGIKVRLIGGVDDHYNIPGYHFNEDFVTVSKPGANPANFVGVRKNQLELIE
jgi:hypothetical protein